MLSKNKFKYIQSLRLKKIRQKNSAFIVEGEKMVNELLTHPKFEIELLCATEDWVLANPNAQKFFAKQLITINDKELKSISNLSTPNRVLAVARQPNNSIEANLLEKSLSLYLDSIQDPGNMGTILRIADWFGLPYVICSKTCADLYNPKVIQATMGAFLRVKVVEMDFAVLKSDFPDMTYYGAVLDGQNVFEMELAPKGIIVIGNESKGISNEIIEQLDKKIKIPSGKHGGAESLNAGVATGIICAAFVR